MNVPWYYAAGGETHGPLDWAGLRAAARDGRFGPADHVWTPGYGTEWKKASELGTLFPPPPAPSGPEAEAPSEPEAAPDAAPPPLRNLRVVERSPFRPPAPDGRTSAPPRVLQSLRNAWTNLRTILFEPFSLRRAGVFCLCALLLFLGAQSELPSGADDPEARSRLEAAGPGLAALAELRDGIVLRAARLRDEAGDLDRPDALRAAAGADQVVAMHGGGHAHGLAARAHELQQRHLGGCILHRHAVRTELAEILQRRQLAQGATVIEMGIQDLLGKSKRPPQRFPRGGDPLLISSVKGFDYLRIEHKGKYTTN